MKIKNLILASIIALISLPAFAESPNFNPINPLGRTSVTFAASTTTNINGPLIQLRRGQTLSVQATMVAAGANVTTPTFNFQWSLDGKTWTTATPTAVTSQTTSALNGTTPVNWIGVVAVPSGTFPRYARLATIVSGAGNNLTVSNMVCGIWDP